MSFWVALLLGAFGTVMLLDWVITRMYRYNKLAHRRTPAQASVPYEEVWIPGQKGARLYGWWMPAGENAPALILVHGWGRNLERMMPYIRTLHPLGYSLLAFDARNHGNSSPLRYPTVWTFSQDTMAAAEYLAGHGLAQPGRIGIVGLSVGGGAAINASALDERLAAVVTVGAISHPVKVMEEEFRRRGVPAFLGRVLLAYMRLRFGLDFDAIAPVNNIPRSRAAILLVHGERDETISMEQAEALLQAGDSKRVQLWLVPGKGHSDCHTHPEFWERVSAFLQDHLPTHHS